jgi:hypothetical protein
LVTINNGVISTFNEFLGLNNAKASLHLMGYYFCLRSGVFLLPPHLNPMLAHIERVRAENEQSASVESVPSMKTNARFFPNELRIAVLGALSRVSCPQVLMQHDYRLNPTKMKKQSQILYANV